MVARAIIATSPRINQIRKLVRSMELIIFTLLDTVGRPASLTTKWGLGQVDQFSGTRHQDRRIAKTQESEIIEPLVDVTSGEETLVTLKETCVLVGFLLIVIGVLLRVWSRRRNSRTFTPTTANSNETCPSLLNIEVAASAPPRSVEVEARFGLIESLLTMELEAATRDSLDASPADEYEYFRWLEAGDQFFRELQPASLMCAELSRARGRFLMDRDDMIGADAALSRAKEAFVKIEYDLEAATTARELAYVYMSHDDDRGVVANLEYAARIFENESEDGSLFLALTCLFISYRFLGDYDAAITACRLPVTWDH